MITLSAISVWQCHNGTPQEAGCRLWPFQRAVITATACTVCHCLRVTAMHGWKHNRFTAKPPLSSKVNHGISSCQLLKSPLPLGTPRGLLPRQGRQQLAHGPSLYMMLPFLHSSRALTVVRTSMMTSTSHSHRLTGAKRQRHTCLRTSRLMCASRSTAKSKVL